MSEPKIRELAVSQDLITAQYSDGRAIRPDVDEDISVEGMLSGVPARRSHR